jgi:hypothetical protein
LRRVEDERTTVRLELRSRGVMLRIAGPRPRHCRGRGAFGCSGTKRDDQSFGSLSNGVFGLGNSWRQKRGVGMKKISDYKRHAEECRKLAAAATLREHRSQLIGMAETWEMLADQREREIARQARLKKLALTTDLERPRGASSAACPG